MRGRDPPWPQLVHMPILQGEAQPETAAKQAAMSLRVGARD